MLLLDVDDDDDDGEDDDKDDEAKKTGSPTSFLPWNNIFYIQAN